MVPMPWEKSVQCVAVIEMVGFVGLAMICDLSPAPQCLR